MQRREALRLLAASATLPLLSRDAFSLFQAVHDQLSETPVLKVLNPHQNATVTTISELIIPQTDTPGAKGARVNEFIDAILAEWYDGSEKSVFLAGLADVDVRSRNLFGKAFVDCAQQQQVQILTALDEELADVREESERLRRRRTDPPEKKFFYMMKQLTLVGYYTSETGFVEELHWEIIPSRHGGCESIEEEAGK
jgi:hypothetical protein